MPTYKQFVDEQVRLLRAKGIVVFCGAGISLNSGLPLVGPFMTYVFTQLRTPGATARLIRRSSLPFESFVETVLDDDPHADKFLESFVADNPTTTHLLLAKLARKGIISTILTTNFDLCLERAFELEGLVRDRSFLVAYRQDHFATIDWADHGTVKLIKLHGSVEDKRNMLITLGRVSNRALSASRTTSSAISLLAAPTTPSSF